MSGQAQTRIATALLGAAACLAACSAPAGEAKGEPGGSADSGAGASIILERAGQLALACSGCHGEAGGAIVSLDGYSREQLLTSLSAYKADTGGTTVMHRLMRGYSDTDIEAVSAWLAGGDAH